MYINPISYPGNKNRLLKEILPLFPQGIDTFVDVFCGSGVVGINSNCEFIKCNDISKQCLQILEYFYINSFEKIISELELIINSCGLTYSHRDGKTYKEKKHEGLSIINKDSYNKLKDLYNQDPSVDKLVVLAIYGFNHYIRFNKQGIFNVPVGKVDLSDSIYSNLYNFINFIKTKKISFSNYDFRNKDLYSDDSAIYYFDPPYFITTAPYNSSWSKQDEIDLLNLLDNLNSAGKRFCLSNVFLSNGKKNEELIDWSKKYKVFYLKRQYRNANYQKVNLTDSVEVLIRDF